MTYVFTVFFFHNFPQHKSVAFHSIHYLLEPKFSVNDLEPNIPQRNKANERVHLIEQ
ncbi:hypothetical protein BLOT_009781 [Blomia tropicalis]|nr:hypothetical protein BLOT_009781 [Blomia tropicalis]